MDASLEGPRGKDNVPVECAIPRSKPTGSTSSQPAIRTTGILPGGPSEVSAIEGPRAFRTGIPLATSSLLWTAPDESWQI